MSPNVALLDKKKSNLFYLDKGDCKTIIDSICDTNYNENEVEFNDDASQIDTFKI